MTLLEDRTHLLTERPMRGLDRWVIVAYGMWAITLGVLEWFDRTADREVFLPTIWPFVFLAAGLAAMAYAWTAGWRDRQWSGSLIAVACLGRGAGLLWGIVQGTAPSTARALIGWAVWSGMAAALVILWRFIIPVNAGGPCGRRPPR